MKKEAEEMERTTGGRQSFRFFGNAKEIGLTHSTGYSIISGHSMVASGSRPVASGYFTGRDLPFFAKITDGDSPLRNTKSH